MYIQYIYIYTYNYTMYAFNKNIFCVCDHSIHHDPLKWTKKREAVVYGKALEVLSCLFPKNAGRILSYQDTSEHAELQQASPATDTSRVAQVNVQYAVTGPLKIPAFLPALVIKLVSPPALVLGPESSRFEQGLTHLRGPDPKHQGT